MIDRRHIGGQQQQHVRQAEVIDGPFRQSFQPSHHVIGEETDHATRQRRKTRLGLTIRRSQQLQGHLQRPQRVSASGSVLGHGTQPYRLPLTHGQRRWRPRTDKRPSRPRPAVLGRLQQERTRAIGGELAVGRQRRLAVGQDLASHRNHPVLGRQEAEILTRGGGCEVGVHRTIFPDTPIGPGVARRRCTPRKRRAWGHPQPRSGAQGVGQSVVA
ncbi:Uncharacterised protein [Mycobacterium tuberculosis]|nr:Uncharacterised protein [Mycobacterium tuberculosis]